MYLQAEEGASSSHPVSREKRMRTLARPGVTVYGYTLGYWMPDFVLCLTTCANHNMDPVMVTASGPPMTGQKNNPSRIT